MKTLIFDRNVGFLQHVSSKSNLMEALEEFDATVGIDPDNKGLDTHDWYFRRVDDAMADKIMDWSARGSPASEFPREDLSK